MDRTYTLKLHRDERVGARDEAELYRVDADGGLELVAQLTADDDAVGIGRVMELLKEALIDYEDEHGELP